VVAFPAWRPGDIIGLLGLGSVAINFAFPDIFKNFLAGILLLREPFLWGDQIFVEGFEGTVEKISMCSTQILTDGGERVIVPNAIVFRAC
jgi:small-conductance mechanosensitive channel